MKKYKAVVVDDEDKNLKLLSHFIEKFCMNIQIVGLKKTVSEALSLINEFKPDILYLDIKLKDSSSFDILNNINNKDFEVIFITAYKEFAIKAIKFNVVDYILKPISIDDFILATHKAITNIQEKISKKNLSSNTDFITVHNLDKIELVKIKDLIYCESDGRYTILYLKEKVITASKNLGFYEDLLKKNFIRVHNSYIINLNYIKVINKKNGFFCEMINGKKIPVSKRKQSLLSNL